MGFRKPYGHKDIQLCVLNFKCLWLKYLAAFCLMGISLRSVIYDLSIMDILHDWFPWIPGYGNQ